MRRAPVVKRVALTRKARLRARPRVHVPEPGEEEWKRQRSGPCTVCGGWSDWLHHHHIYYERKVRQEGGDPWAPQNGMFVCELCHMRHHSAFRRIPMSKVSREARRWLARLIGADRAQMFFERFYGAG